MNRLFTISAIISIAVGAFSQSPEKMSYQAIVRNSSNQLVTNQAVGMKISVLQGTSADTIVYQEIYNPNPQTDADGLISIEIGGGIPITGTFSSIDWANGPYFIKTETDPTGGTNYTITGTSQLLSVPYALYAEKARSEFSGNYNDLTGRPDFTKWDKDSTDNVNLTDDQTIAGIKTFAGEIDAGNKRITHLATPVNDYNAANKFYIDSLINQLYAQGALRVKDFDGNHYNTIKIGNQIWMAENLKTTHWSDGTKIPMITDNTEWMNLTTAAYCWYDNNDTIYKNTYGALYNWYTLTANKLCPIGWHVPSDAEWTSLTNYLGGPMTAGGKLKETGTIHWNNPNAATNESGFTALPGGDRIGDGSFMSIGEDGYWWSSTDENMTYAQRRDMHYTGTDVGHGYSSKYFGFSVRCLKD